MTLLRYIVEETKIISLYIYYNKGACIYVSQIQRRYKEMGQGPYIYI